MGLVQRFIIAACVYAWGACSAHATLVWSPATTINEIIAMTEYGNGDVVFIVSSTTSGCEAGFWLRASDPGFKSAYAALLTNYASGRPLTVVAYDDSLWTGSSQKFCRVHYLRPTQ